MNKLAQNIEALNIHNAKVKEYYLSALEQLAPLIGKKVRTAKNERAKAFNIELTPIRGKHGNNHLDIHYWFEFTGRSVWLNVKTCLNGGSYDAKPVTAFCIYVENAVYLGETNDEGVLTSVANESTRESYLKNLDPVTIEVIREKEAKYKEAQETARKIYDSIPEHLRKVLYLNR